MTTEMPQRREIPLPSVFSRELDQKFLQVEQCRIQLAELEREIRETLQGAKQLAGLDGDWIYDRDRRAFVGARDDQS